MLGYVRANIRPVGCGILLTIGEEHEATGIFTGIATICILIGCGVHSRTDARKSTRCFGGNRVDQRCTVPTDCTKLSNQLRCITEADIPTLVVGRELVH